MTSQFTRRGMLLLYGAGVLAARPRWTARDSDFWNRKERSQWSSEEIDKLITGIGGRGNGQSQFELIVRWESAKPVMEVLKMPLAEVFANHYVIGVSGIPNVHATAEPRESAFLEGKGLHPVKAAVVQHAPGSFTQSVLFGFPIETLHLSLDDNEITFTTQVVKSPIRVKFNLKEMVYRDALAV